MRFTLPIKDIDVRLTGKPGTRGRLGSPVALTTREVLEEDALSKDGQQQCELPGTW